MNKNNRLWVTLSILALAFAVISALMLFGSPVNRNDPVPSTSSLSGLSFMDTSGEQLTVASFTGRATLINVWATWCAPCRKEMPELDRLQGRLGGDRFQVVTLSIDRTGAEAVLPFFKEIGISNLKVYLDPSMSVMSSAGIVGLPTTILVDAGGMEVYRWVGPRVWDGPQAIEAIDHFLSTGDVSRLDLPVPK